MKFPSFALLSVVASCAVAPGAEAFAPIKNIGAASRRSTSITSLDYSVGIVGATGAVGKEIRQCLENRDKLPVDQLRIFGSERSAGTSVSTKYGTVSVEKFSVELARQCDVVFLAVDGDFALANAKAICEGEDGAVVIDNSVRILRVEILMSCVHNTTNHSQ
jgi:predicted dinucleotide-binding enzyme